MTPQYDFSIMMGEKINLQCTVSNPESLLNVTNGSLVMTKDGTVLSGICKMRYSLTILILQYYRSRKKKFQLPDVPREFIVIAIIFRRRVSSILRRSATVRLAIHVHVLLGTN